MSDEERQASPLADERLDVLLTDFYRREIPADLLARRPRTVATPTVSRTGRGVSQRAAGAALLIACACLLLTVGLLSVSPSPIEEDSAPARLLGQGVDGVDDASNVVESSDEAERRLGPIDVPADAPVEVRSKMGLRNVIIHDPWSGSEVEVVVPGLDIEIYPIEDEDESPVRSPFGNPGDSQDDE